MTPEVQNHDGSRHPVSPHFSFAEGLIGIAAIRDYTRMRREQGQGEDAILAYFYSTLLNALRDAHAEDPDAFDAAQRLAEIPDALRAELKRRDDPRDP